jgi:hypothetical protein
VQANVPSFVKSKLILPLRVHGIVENSQGKTPTIATLLSFIEYRTFASLAAKHLHPWHNRTFINAFESQSSTLYESVPQIVFSKRIPRYETYLASNFDALAKSLLSWGSEIRLIAGYEEVDSTFPVLLKLLETKQISSLLGILISLILIVLVSLSTFLIYSILMASVSVKSFEFGVLRIIGLPQHDMFLLIMVRPVYLSAIASSDFVYIKKLIVQIRSNQCRIPYLLLF